MDKKCLACIESCHKRGFYHVWCSFPAEDYCEPLTDQEASEWCNAKVANGEGYFTPGGDFVETWSDFWAED